MPRKVEYDVAAKFAKDNNCNYMEVSAYSGHNIKNMFFNMVQEVHKKTKSSSTPPPKPNGQDKPNSGTSVLRDPRD